MNHSEDAFTAQFVALTGHRPMPWQIALFQRFLTGDFPAACDLPTGLGKTSTIPIWLLALAAAPSVVPRRLVYVVNRRTVVDQATREAEKLKERLDDPARFADSTAASTLADVAHRLRSIFQGGPKETPLAISTLRGQYADNREWSADPSRPAVICGTVDMIGSRLLFSGYRCGFKSRPLHAGFLGQDVLLVHDEAHLEFPFQKLLTNIQREQQRRGDTLKTFYVMELSATSRSDGNVFRLSEADFKHEIVKKRLNSTKRIELHPIDDEKATPDALVEKALAHVDSGGAILVFAHSVEWVEKVAEQLSKDKRVGETRLEVLTGTMRGNERDRLPERPVFKRFLPPGDRPLSSEPMLEGVTVYLVCTSAGEVGVNISADHLVCDLTTFESMAQRFGRVNRFGELSDTRIDVVYPTTLPSKEKVDELLGRESDKPKPELIRDDRRRRTLELLEKLDHNGSPHQLSSKGPLGADEKKAAFTPPPDILPTSSILFDAWAMTTIRDRFQGRPVVEPYLHGLSEYEPARTSVAWREEVERLAGLSEFNDKRRQELLDDYPLKPHELLSDRTDRVFKQLQRIAARLGGAASNTPVWVIDSAEELSATTLQTLASSDKDSVERATIILPPSAGGLLGNGMLVGGEATSGEKRREDVADEWFIDGRRQRLRVMATKDEGPDETAPAGMQLVCEIDLAPDADEVSSADESGSDGETSESKPRCWRWYELPESGEADPSKTTKVDFPVTWDAHTRDVVAKADQITAALNLPVELSRAIALAAEFHDLGKKRRLWQRSIGNYRREPLLAKAEKKMNPGSLNSYRHEFGSLLDLRANAKFLAEPLETQDLIAHLVAVHHGRGRPHFAAAESFDPEHPQKITEEVSAEIPLRFARLQRKYGRWGLAYLESLLRAADIVASANPMR